MANAAKDENDVSTLIAVSSADGSTPIRIYGDPTTHRLLVSASFATASTTWATTGNTNTVTDANVTSSSFISVMFATPPAGFWAIVPGNGSFVITSSDPESAGLAFKYKVFT